MSELVRRIGVAAVLAPIALLAAWAGGVWLVAFGLVAVVGALHEYFRVAHGLRPIPLTGHLGGAGIVIAAAAGGVEWTLAVVIGTIVATFLVTAALASRESALVSIAVTVLGPLWIGYGVAFLILLRDVDGEANTGLNLLLAVLVGVWTNDIFAYFGGRLVGRRRLAPAISPNKTVEGFVIGLAFGTFAAWVTLYENPLPSLEAFEVAFAVSLAGPIGDLFASFLKRDLGVKDWGRVLGPHGGVLDRIDALLFASAAAYFVLLALGRT